MANRLINEKSPYLLQHAYNPVDWFPWGEEAFEKARRESKPVMVSIGYSTCHWCHVMEQESFEDEEVATILNEKFVSIKVDREERPDIDSIYMKVCQALTGQGGWPLNVFLTPEQKPFYAGTYFPKKDRFGRPGLINVLNQLAMQYEQNHEKVIRVSDNILQALSQNEESSEGLKEDVIDDCFSHYHNTFDEQYGGFGSNPKFPSPHQLMFLLRYHYWKEDDDALSMVVKTLDAMANGGIYDHIGYGFARYSVDEKWLVPHFEKMLYDNAMLAIAYTEAFQLIGNSSYQQIVDEILTYISRDMLDSGGGFYSAEDADSEGVEGKFYLWDIDEIYEVLDKETADLFCRAYNITRTGNFEGHNIPNLIDTSVHHLADEVNIPVKVLLEKLEEAKKSLLAIRGKRIHPHKDDKILTSWNALMITAFAKAGMVFGDENYLLIAKQALSFIEEKLTVDGKLMARFRNGEVKHLAYIDDYAFMIWALDTLYDTTFDPSYIIKAKYYADQMIELFWDKDEGGFFINQHQEDLIMRPKEIYDGAIPSGNSVAAYQLLRLSKRTGETTYDDFVKQMFKKFSSDVERYPAGYSFFLMAFMQTLMSTNELVIIKGSHRNNFEEAVLAIQKSFLPEVILIAGEKKAVMRAAPYTEPYTLIDDQTTYYYCHHFQCDQPTTDFHTIKTKLFT